MVSSRDERVSRGWRCRPREEEILEFEGAPDDLDAVGLGLMDVVACSYVLGVPR